MIKKICKISFLLPDLVAFSCYRANIHLEKWLMRCDTKRAIWCEYSRRNKTVPRQLMPWLIASLRGWPWYKLHVRKINGILSSMKTDLTWWRHQMETFSASLAICAWNSPVSGEFPAQRPVTWSFDVFFDLRRNGRLSKHSWGWWLETPSRPVWRHSNALSAPRGISFLPKKRHIYLFPLDNSE